MSNLHKGTAATRDFYDRIGWRRQNGVLTDVAMFGWRDGKIRRALNEWRTQRVMQAVRNGKSVLEAVCEDKALKIAELGCGGTPAVFLAKQCAAYTGIDFSSAGLTEAAKALAVANVAAFETVEADITDLPLEDGKFDVVYSSHVLYHIDTADGQAAAIKEAMRIVKPGGRAIFVLANPFPLLFPYRALRRALAMTPGLNTMLNWLRAKPPLPYLPMPLGWMRKQLEKWGRVKITGYAIPSVEFDRRVSETSALGRVIWRVIQRIETRHPAFAARAGCYVLIEVDRR